MSDKLANILKPILPFLESLKAKSKSYLLYNFIVLTQLIKILRGFGFSDSYISCLAEDVLEMKNELVNLNILCDLCLGLEIEG